MCNKEIAITDATSSGNQPTFVPRNAIDRNPNTKWQSTFTSNPWERLTLGGLNKYVELILPGLIRRNITLIFQFPPEEHIHMYLQIKLELAPVLPHLNPTYLQ